MIKIDLITGFLGSGKTTFILKYARFLMNRGLKTGILEYDYGAVNSDMALLSELRGPQCEIEMLTAACDSDCLNRRFRTKLISMAMMGYDRIIVEPSGIFDPDMFFDSLREDPLEKWYETGSVITVVSAKPKRGATKEENFILASQAAVAGCILLSRVQNATTGEIEEVKAQIEKAAAEINCRNFNPRYFEKDWSDFEESDFEKLMNCGYRRCDYTKITAGGESDFSSMSFLNINEKESTLREKAKKLFGDKKYGSVMRVKGFFEENGAMYQFNATADEVLCEKINFNQKVLIVIGRNLNDNEINKLMEETTDD